MTNFNEEVVSKWKPVLEHPELPSIRDSHKRHVIAQLLENTEKVMRQEGGMSPSALLEVATNSVGTGGYSGAASATGGVAGYDPILISLIRRAMPNLVAYDICGVQPMTGPTGLIFRNAFTIC